MAKNLAESLDRLKAESPALAERVVREIGNSRNPDVRRIIGPIIEELRPLLDLRGRDGGDDAMWTTIALRNFTS